MLSAAALVILGLLPYVASQSNVTAPTCQAGFDWAFSSTGQSPCEIAAELGGVCSGGQFSLLPLDPGFVYLGPNQDNANSCRCSSVYYSLLSACALCQDRSFIRWSAYNSNCTTVYLQVYQQAIPVGVSVPNYAYLDVSEGDIFNATAAQADNGPESTRLPSPTGTSPAANTNVGASSGGGKSNAGAIAGGVVGGVVGLAIIAGLVFWFLRRRKASKDQLPSAPPSTFDPGMSQVQTTYTGTTFPSTYPTTPAPTGTPGKIYDPNDPSTFPTAEYPASFNPYSTPSPELNQQYQVPFNGQNVQQHNVHPNYTGNSSQAGLQMPAARPHYTGAPEL
ncbi:hypothetical protein NLJ89_g5122 [Agrocybe chaxingu]|uniref:Uncharacterized protein n=1 Tax=Agrocybe chaxingu TaxID=84603 RepID=A0A9W8K1F3_9AGAR|nr:hypothetical protein NLJ89_g5122 [Agrocybe chaxingu]